MHIELEDFELPMAAIIKHSNPCGAAVAASLALLNGHWQTMTMISSIRLDGSTACT